MAEIMEQQLQNLYTVYYQKYDGALLYHDGLYDVRRAYFTSGGKRQKNKVVKEADGVSYRYSYLMERGQPLKWKKLEGFRQVEISEPDAAGGYHILTQDENKKVVKIAYYDRDHLWKRTDYYSPRLRQQPMEILEPGENGVLLLRELKAGRYDDARALYPCKVPKSPEAESFLSNQVPVPELTVRSQSGDFYYCEQELAQKREALLEEYQRGGGKAPQTVFQEEAGGQNAVSEPQDEDRPDREGGFTVASQKPDPEKPEDNSYEWGAGDSAFEKYKEEPEQSSGVKYTEEYEYPYQEPKPEEKTAVSAAGTGPEAAGSGEEPAYRYDRVEEREPEKNSRQQEYVPAAQPAPVSEEEKPSPRRYNVAVKPMSADTYTASDRIAPPAVKEAVAQEDGGAETPYAEKGELKDLCNGVMNGCPYIAMGKMSICVSLEECYYYFGSVEDGLREGRGRTAMMDGGTAFEGGYLHDQRDGFGTYYYKSGKLCYAGDWKENRRNGMGVSFKASNGSCYAGFWNQDSPVGPGALLSKEKGLVYAGYFEDGKRSGAGVSFQPEDRSLFIGQWRNGVQQLKGTLVDQDGTLLYSGGFANGKRSGTGTEYDPNGQVRYTGKWAENAWNGEGVWYREDGHVIKGQFRSGAVDGQAVEYSKNGVKLYEGGFENGVYSGRGCRYFPGGGRYEGSFLAGKPVGWLSGYDADGNLVYEGHWENDEFQGQGRYFSNGEKVYEGEFSHNQFEGQGLEYQNGEIAYRGGYVCSSREGLGVLYENGEPRYAGEFRQNRMHGRINEIQNGRVLAECVYQDGVLRYEKRYSLSDGKPYLAFEGFMKNGKPGGMGCRYNPYGEKVEEGLYQDGELAKSMQVAPKKMPLLPENPENPAYEAYRKGPEYGIELPVCGGIYTGVLKNGLPNGRGTILRGDHRYTGEFINGAPAGRGVLYQNDGTIIEGKFFMEPAGFTGLRHLAFENGIEYWYQ